MSLTTLQEKEMFFLCFPAWLSKEQVQSWQQNLGSGELSKEKIMVTQHVIAPWTVSSPQKPCSAVCR